MADQRINGPDVVSGKLKNTVIKVWNELNLGSDRLFFEGSYVKDASGRIATPGGSGPWAHAWFRTRRSSRKFKSSRGWIWTDASFMIDVWMNSTDHKPHDLYRICDPIIGRLNRTRIDRTFLFPAEARETRSQAGWLIGVIQMELYFQSRFQQV